MYVPKVVLTGGPCAGKTSAKAFLSERLREIGYFPIFVPESATMLFASGVQPDPTSCALIEFQRALLRMTCMLEDEYTRLAGCVHSGRPILICDRGVCDARAYMPGAMFSSLLVEMGLDMSTARDARYLGVLHMRSAAVGAPEYYTTATNESRRESVAEAKRLDEATLEAWLGHPDLAVVGNEYGSFDRKLHELYRRLLRMLHEPVPLEICRKYLVDTPDLARLPVHATSEITQTYLEPDMPGISEYRVRKRGTLGAYTHYKAIIRYATKGQRIKTQSIISRDEYDQLLKRKKEDTHTIVKTRRSFVFQNQYFDLDSIQKPVSRNGVHLLELRLTDARDVVTLPPYLHVRADVTENMCYRNHAFAMV